MSFMDELKGSLSKRRYLRHGHLVFEVVPLVSDDLWRVGFAALEGSAAYQQAQVENERELRKRRAGLMAPDATAETLAKGKADIERFEATAASRALTAFLSNLQQRGAWLQRCDAHICAGIVAGCRVDPDVFAAAAPAREAWEAKDDKSGDPEGELVRTAEIVDTLPEAWRCSPVEPCRFVMLEAEEGEGSLWVARLGETLRGALGTSLIGLRNVGPLKEVRPFRPGSGAVRAAGSGVPAVLDPAVGTAESIASGHRDPVGDSAGGDDGGPTSVGQDQTDGGAQRHWVKVQAEPRVSKGSETYPLAPSSER